MNDIGLYNKILPPFSSIQMIDRHQNYLMGLLKKKRDNEIYNRNNYSFSANNLKSINFKKIADDLSYSDPFRIVEFKDSLYAVVHHTVYDKYIRSETKKEHIHPAIKGVIAIKHCEIGIIVRSIKMIKKARWLKKKESKNAFNVTVRKINI